MRRIRLAIEGDGPALAEIYRPAVAERATSFETDAPGGVEMARRVSALTPLLPWLVYEDGSVVRGYAYASRHRDRAAYQWSVEVSAYVHASAHRRGIGAALYASLFEALILLGYRNAFAGITLPNDASVGFHEAAGFTRIGVYRAIGWKLGAWHDVLWLQRGLGPRVPDPPAPQPLAALAGSRELESALAAGLARMGPAR